MVTAARDALPTRDAAVAREVLASNLLLLAMLDQHVHTAEENIAELLPASPFAPMLTVPGWGQVRAAAYGAAVGDPERWPQPR